MAPQLLPDELVEEFLLRFPPHEPARLVQAALVCKRWCRLVSEPRFRRRFREFHRTPPMLGFSCNLTREIGGCRINSARFVPTASCCAPQADRCFWRALDARHGRVLLRKGDKPFSPDALAVWDPITDEHQELPVPPRYTHNWTAAVLCANGGSCDHLDCHRGPFLVVVLGSDHREMFTCVYSSDDDEWSEPISIQQPSHFVRSVSSMLMGNALYFWMYNKILKYDTETHEASLIQLPHECSNRQCAVLTTAEDRVLEFAKVHESKLYLWSRKVTPEVDGEWVQSRVIELETLLPNDALFTSPDIVGFADGIGVIFLKGANGVVFTIDMKNYKVTKVCEGHDICTIVPYMSFYTPALGATCTSEWPSTGASSA